MNLKTIFEAVGRLLHLIKSDAQQALLTANKLVNEILEFEQSPTGQIIEGIVEAVLPAELKAAYILWLPKILKALQWATDEAGKSDQQIISDGMGYFKGLTGDVKATQANTLAALTSKFISDNTQAGLNIQTAITAAQPVHDGTLNGAV